MLHFYCVFRGLSLFHNRLSFYSCNLGETGGLNQQVNYSWGKNIQQPPQLVVPWWKVFKGIHLLLQEHDLSLKTFEKKSFNLSKLIQWEKKILFIE